MLRHCNLYSYSYLSKISISPLFKV